MLEAFLPRHCIPLGEDLIGAEAVFLGSNEIIYGAARD